MKTAAKDNILPGQFGFMIAAGIGEGREGRGIMAMRIVAASIVALMVASQTASADVKRHASIPEPLQGSWAPSSDRCKADDKSVIVLAAKAYTSAEKTCAVDWVAETAAPRGATYSAHLQCPGQPGQPASASNRIIRPDGATQISSGSDFTNLATYQKCPVKE